MTLGNARDKLNIKFAKNPEWLFTDNHTNNERLYGGKNDKPYVKDSFHSYVIHDKSEASNSFAI
jgi:hypothetical protein